MHHKKTEINIEGRMKLFESSSEIDRKNKKRKRIFLCIAIFFVIMLLINFGGQKSPSAKLLDAVLANDNKQIALLLKKGADPNHYLYFYMEEKILLAAVKLQNEKAVKMLLDAGADPNLYKDKKWRTALHIAVELQNEKIVKMLLDAGANPNTLLFDGGSALILSIFSEKKIKLNPNITKMLIKAGAKVNYNIKGLTALLVACAMPHSPENVAALIKAGANVNAIEPYNHLNCLMIALANGKPEIKYQKAELLLKAGANVNYVAIHPDKTKITALLMAAMDSNDLKLTALLLKYKADPLFKYKGDEIILDYIDEEKHPKLYQLINNATQKRLKEVKAKTKI